MKTISIEPERATLELSMAELGLIMNALWRELGYQEERLGPLDDDLRKSYDTFQKQIGNVIAGMDDNVDSES